MAMPTQTGWQLEMAWNARMAVNGRFSWASSTFFNRCARCTLGCTKICVGWTTKKGFI